MDTQSKKTSSSALLAAAWLVVIVPAGWGLTYTVQNALKIFTHTGPAGAPPAPTTSPALTPPASTTSPAPR